MSYLHLTQTVADAFNTLADEVQVLADRKTILEHKLRFAHEQVSSVSFFFVRFFRDRPEIASLPQHDENLSSRSRTAGHELACQD